MSPYLSRIEGPPPKRDAARSNRAGDANPPKTLRFRGIPFPKTSPVELRFIIPCNAYYRCIYIKVYGLLAPENRF